MTDTIQTETTTTKVLVRNGNLKQLLQEFQALVDPPQGFTSALHTAISYADKGHMTFHDFWNVGRYLDIDAITGRAYYDKAMVYFQSHGRAERLDSLEPSDPVYLLS